MQHLTTVESMVCGFTSGFVAAIVVQSNLAPEFWVIVALHLAAVSVSLYLALAVLLLMLKNEGSWWGW